MKRLYFKAFFSVVTYVACDAPISAATDWIAVYWLGEWDPKFGRSGSLQLANQLLPYVIAVALVSHLVAILARWRWLRVADLRRVVAVPAGSAGLTGRIPC